MRKSDLKKYCDRLKELGCDRAAVVDSSSVVTAEWVRFKCRYGCPGYGGTLMCPPHSPTPGETAEVISSYNRAILVHSDDHRLIDKIMVKLESELYLDGYYRAFAMGSGPCRLCKTCSFEDGCKKPYLARPAMEACGIDVFQTARNNGFDIDVVREKDDVADYFGLVLVE